MIIKEFNLGNTKIAIDNTYLAKTEEEKENIYQQFNKIACKILCEGKWEKTKDILQSRTSSMWRLRNISNKCSIYRNVCIVAIRILKGGKNNVF